MRKPNNPYQETRNAAGHYVSPPLLPTLGSVVPLKLRSWRTKGAHCLAKKHKEDGILRVRDQTESNSTDHIHKKTSDQFVGVCQGNFHEIMGEEVTISG